MRVQGAPEPFSIASQELFQESKREYKAGLDASLPNNRFMRNRRGLGGTGDYHLDAWQLWYVREVSRHMDRCDSLPGQVNTRLVDSLFAGSQYSIEPDTGDPGLDLELWNRHDAWARNKRACDWKGERTLAGLQWIIKYQTVMDGDIFGTLNDDGTIELVEGDRCVSPAGEWRSGSACGIEIAGGKRVAFWFAKSQPLGPWGSADDLERREIYREDGLQIAFQSYGSHRVSQNRGYSWWHPVMVEAGMLDDLDFAMILKAQSAAAIAGTLESLPDPSGYPHPNAAMGTETTKTAADGTTQVNLSLKPGAMVELPAGKKLSGYTPAVPNPEHIEHVKYQLRKLGGALNMPYVALMLDASETNFSGFRGAMEVVRQSWRRIQKDHIEQFVSPVWAWRAMRELPSLGAAAMKRYKAGTLINHRVRPPRWKYIQPLQDAQADALVVEERLDSPRSVCAERGVDFDDVARETVEDNGQVIELAIQKAAELNKQYPGANVNWREVARWKIESSLAQVMSADEDKGAGGKPANGGNS